MKDLITIVDNQWPQWVKILMLCLFITLITLIFKWILTFVIKKTNKESGYSVIHSFLKHLSSPLNFLLPLFFINAFLPYFGMDSAVLQGVRRWLDMLLVASFAYLLITMLRVLEDFVYHAYKLEKADNLKERKIRTQLQFVRKVAVSLVVIIAIAIILLSFDGVRKIGAGLLTGVGIGGIIIGFAAQKSLGNFLAGLQIAFTQPIRIDDVLVVEGEWGRVEEITLTYVVLNIWDQRRLILPINYFIEQPFQNWTRNTSEILGTAFFYVDPTFSVDALRAELERVLANSSLWDQRVGILQVTDIKENVVELRALVSAEDSGQAFDLRCEVREQLLKFIKANAQNELPKTRVLLQK
ncbi:mechanosensitive ion channel family protein [Pedobacter sp. SL55]|uniref:mechanosensitive ion channel family protein n=1 Tax=Pedobacter sp. SL55 TaxID=2995161 RepID=UPI00226F92A7|nr:mechanosensitive ion channel domain-containing protein [Pedobacter sp. SL55]WAC40927.1 mechanosensitive ion channel [Pedobacter sp. SL55]